MDTLPSVQNKKVYDVLGSGEYTWLEQRTVEADVVLEDFCQVVGHIDEIAIPHQRKYFRKALPAGEEPAGSLGPLGTCSIDDIEEPMESRAGACFKYVGQTDGGNTNGGNGKNEEDSENEEDTENESSASATSASFGLFFASMFAFFAI